VFEAEAESTDEIRTGNYIYDRVLGVALEWIANHLISAAGTSMPRILVGTMDNFPTDMYAQKYAEEPVRSGNPIDTHRRRSLRILIRHGTNVDVVLESSADYIQYMQEHFDKILLPYCLSNCHFVVFEITYKGRARGPYIKVWDSLDMMGQVQDPISHPELQVLCDSFFLPGQELSIYHRRHHNDPNQGSSEACAAFTFFTVAHLALMRRPPPATTDDEAYLRNFMIGCCVHGSFLPLPQIVFKE